MVATPYNVILAVLAGTGSVTRDAYSGSRDVGSGTSGGEGLTLLFNQVIGNI